jgi:hypothetical protein
MARSGKPTKWRIRGDYMETCNCDYLCPCIYTHMTAMPTHTVCSVAMLYHIGKGRFGNVPLDGLSFVIVAQSPGPMHEGNWKAGVIVDRAGGTDQRAALAAIAQGEAGGPMSHVKGLVGEFLGVEARAIRFTKSKRRARVHIHERLDQAVEAQMTDANPDEPMCIDNVMHPANSRLGLAKAKRSHVHAFGIDFDDTSGNNNGHIAPFDWRSG